MGTGNDKKAIEVCLVSDLEPGSVRIVDTGAAWVAPAILSSRAGAAPVTWYARGHPGHPFFPEALAIYNADPAWMLASLPDLHAWFESLSNTGTAPP